MRSGGACACAKDPSRGAACGKLQENVDLTPGAARRWLLGWRRRRRRRRRPSRRTRRATALLPARTRRPATRSRPAWTLAGPGGRCPLRLSPRGPRARRPAPRGALTDRGKSRGSEQCASVPGYGDLFALRLPPWGGCWRWREPRVSWGSAVCLCSAGPRGRPAPARVARPLLFLPLLGNRSAELPFPSSLLLLRSASVGTVTWL